MVNKKKCPYCKKLIYYNQGREFSSHCGNCKENPGYWRRIEEQRQTVLNKRKNYDFFCKKCGKPYILNLTPYLFSIGKYRKHCSRKCANSRKQTKKQNLSRSKKLTKYSPSERKNRVKKQRLISNRLWKKKKKRIKYVLLGDSCFICQRKFDRMMAHRKDGKSHPDFRLIGNERVIKEIKSGKYVHLCYRCHKGIHFCMDILQLNWNEIIKRIENAKLHFNKKSQKKKAI